MRVLVIDNIDSFVYNLVQYIGSLGYEPVVLQNTSSRWEVERVIEGGIDSIVISPGPKTPRDAGISNYVIRKYHRDYPILGVCLGHQCVGYCFGARIRGARVLKHGKTSFIEHSGDKIFKGVPNPFEAARYHSLVIDEEGLPSCIEVVARSLDDREIMGIKHRDYDVYGLQFHPESIMTKHGLGIIRNFLEL